MYQSMDHEVYGCVLASAMINGSYNFDRNILCLRCWWNLEALLSCSNQGGSVKKEINKFIAKHKFLHPMPFGFKSTKR